MWPCEVEMKDWESQLMAVWNLLLALQWRIQGGSGGLDPTPLVFRPNCGPKGRNIFFLRLVLPPFLRVWMTAQPPTSLSEDSPLRYWCLFLKSTVFRWESFCCHGRATVESIWTKLPSKTEVSIEGEKDSSLLNGLNVKLLVKIQTYCVHFNSESKFHLGFNRKLLQD